MSDGPRDFHVVCEVFLRRHDRGRHAGAQRVGVRVGRGGWAGLERGFNL